METKRRSVDIQTVPHIYPLLRNHTNSNNINININQSPSSSLSVKRRDTYRGVLKSKERESVCVCVSKQQLEYTHRAVEQSRVGKRERDSIEKINVESPWGRNGRGGRRTRGRSERLRSSPTQLVGVSARFRRVPQRCLLSRAQHR